MSLFIMKLIKPIRPWSTMKKILGLLLGLFSPFACAAESATPEHDPVSLIIFWVTLIFLFALLGRYTAKRFHQPAVLGELLIGILIGNLFYFLGNNLFVILRE